MSALRGIGLECTTELTNSDFTTGVVIAVPRTFDAGKRRGVTGTTAVSLDSFLIFFLTVVSEWIEAIK